LNARLTHAWCSIEEMPPDYSRILPWVFALLIPLALYRRFKRTFGRQPLAPRRMIVRITIFVLIGGALALSPGHFYLEELGGLALGVALALWGASRTRFETENGRRYYIPHTYTGIAVTLLFVGRLIYRFTQTSTLAAAGGAAPTAGPKPLQSPLTMGIFFVLVGYYVCYYSWVLWKSRHITPADFEVPPDTRTLARDDGQKRDNQEAGTHQ
jgi:hypothetical protein